MNNDTNEIIIQKESNEDDESKKVISSDVIDYLNLSDLEKKKYNNEKNSANVKSSINNFEISTFKKEDWNKPIKIYS